MFYKHACLIAVLGMSYLWTIGNTPCYFFFTNPVKLLCSFWRLFCASLTDYSFTWLWLSLPFYERTSDDWRKCCQLACFMAKNPRIWNICVAESAKILALSYCGVCAIFLCVAYNFASQNYNKSGIFYILLGNMAFASAWELATLIGKGKKQ